MGRVCAKHNEYYETACPWCEEPEVPSIVMGADEFNAHIAEAAAQFKAEPVPIIISPMPRWPKDKAT